MYKNGEVSLARILELVTKCPKEFQEKCFEVLLSGYVHLEVGATKPPITESQIEQRQENAPSESHIPPAVLPRFKTMAKRLKVTMEKLETLFDFSVDPFALHAVTLPGKNNAEKTRQVVLLAASRSYLSAGLWCADWQEVKALCVNDNCYDSVNHAAILKKGASLIFKNVETGNPIELSSDGIKQAEKLLKSLAEETAE